MPRALHACIVASLAAALRAQAAPPDADWFTPPSLGVAVRVPWDTASPPALAQFHARAFDGTEWAYTVADAGASYLVLPARLSNGFCLFRSAHTEFDVVATPHTRDMLRDGARACRAAGLRLGIAFDTAPEAAGTARDDAAHLALLGSLLDELASAHAPDLVLVPPVDDAARRALVAALAARLRAHAWRILDGGDALPAPDARLAGAARGASHAWLLDVEAGDDDAAAANARCRAHAAGAHLILRVTTDAEGSFSECAVHRLRLLGEWTRAHRAALALPLPASHAAWNTPQHVCTWHPTPDGAGRVVFVCIFGATAEVNLPGIARDLASAPTARGAPVAHEHRGDALVLRMPETPPATASHAERTAHAYAPPPRANLPRVVTFTATGSWRR